MKIAYNGFWPDFNINDNWFNHMFMQYFNDKNIIFTNIVNDADIIVNSVFNYPADNGKAIKMFFTGESRKNGYSQDQLLLGFDHTDFNLKKFRLPLWMTYINWWPEEYNPVHIVGGPTYKVDIEGLSRLKTDVEIQSVLNRPMFCCLVVTNPTENRAIAYNELATIGRVDGFGRMFGNYYTGEKMDILKTYKFNVCFENTIDEGYVTEKLFEAKLAGCIPIYWGDSAARKDFNVKGFIDYSTMSSMQELVQEVKKIYSSNDLMAEYISQPMFTESPSLQPLFDFFDREGLK